MSAQQHRKLILEKTDPAIYAKHYSPIAHLLNTIVVILRSIAPASFALVCFRIWAYLTGRRQHLLFSRTTLWRRILNIWLLLEAGFFFYCQTVGIVSQDQPDPKLVPKMSKRERITLFTRCLLTSESMESFCEGWFATTTKYSDLKRGNLEEWLSWGLFHIHDVKQMSSSEREELNELIRLFETKVSSGALPDGKNENAKLLKFSEEPVKFTHRPFIMYGIVHIVLQEMLAPLALLKMRFRPDYSGNTRYWFRPGHDPNKVPIVIIHGLGVGLLPYVPFIQRLMDKSDASTGPMAGTSILCIELHAVSQRINPPMLHPDRFVNEVRNIVKTCSTMGKAIFCGHSYGTFAVSWIVRSAQDIVAGVGLLDPASMFLHYSDVLYSILYKQPRSPYERFMGYLIREELFFNAHARRHFFWYRNIVFLEDIATGIIPVLVVLSDQDEIVPVRRTLEYVQKYNAGQRLRLPEQGVVCEEPSGPVDLIFLQDCDHGGFVFNVNGSGDIVQNGIERLVGRVEGMI
jgi:pimeloyl-ACP methyl ester carboxylesterase